MNETRTKQGYLRSAWLVIALAFAYGGALAGVHTALAPRIEENKRQETNDVIPDLVPGAVQEGTTTLLVRLDDGREQRVYKTHDASGAHNGWVLPASGSGFADRIEILTGLNEDLSRLTGMYVLDQKETPGLGDYITQSEFRERFRGTEPPLEAVKSDPQGEHQILAISGATVSSWSVCAIVNSAVEQWREPILAAASQENVAGNAEERSRTARAAVRTGSRTPPRSIRPWHKATGLEFKRMTSSPGWIRRQIPLRESG